MNLQEAIEARHSVRKYIDKPISQDIIDILQAKIEECNKLGNLHIQLVTNEPKAFKGKMAYGTFTGVSNYFVMIGKKSEDSLNVSATTVSSWFCLPRLLDSTHVG